MDKKRLILAITLSVVVVVVWAFINPLLFGPSGQAVPPPSSGDRNVVTDTESPSGDSSSPDVSSGSIREIVPVESEEILVYDQVFETDKLEVVFTPRGGLVKSIKLKATPELNNTEVKMVISGETGIYPFRLAFPDFSTAELLFDIDIDKGANQVLFSRVLKLVDGDKQSEFLLTKKFTFYNDEYLFDVVVAIENLDRDMRYLDPSLAAYTLEFGPQLGPENAVRGVRGANYPRYIYYSDGKRKDLTSKVGKEGYKLIDQVATWVGVEGKYFILLCYPPKEFLEPGTLGFESRPVEGLTDKSSTLVFERQSSGRTSIIEDKYQFYIGPKKSEILGQYANKSFDKAVKTSWINWLSQLLKWLLLLLQGWVRNWGVAIILMTIIIKLLLFPLTQKSFKSNSRMQALAPKMNELKEKYKDDPQKMQLETAALYKREGINPLGGCLPLLIQMPIFFALYSLLNNHFELRGAVFITGWISDLSLPETFISLPESINIPIIGNQIRLLPFLMVGMTILQQRFSQNPSASSGQMKIMMYAMPLVFFFIMYNMPSGLVVYWTVQNFLSVFQQIYINSVMKKGKTKNSTSIMDRVKQLTTRRK